MLTIQIFWVAQNRNHAKKPKPNLRKSAITKRTKRAFKNYVLRFLRFTRIYQEWPKFHTRNMGKFFIGLTCTTDAFFYVSFRLSLRIIGLSTSPLHLSLSLATLAASVRGSVFPFRWFFSGFLLDGLSNFNHYGVHERAIFVCLALSILNTYPNHFHLRLITILF